MEIGVGRAREWESNRRMGQGIKRGYLESDAVAVGAFAVVGRAV